MCYGMCKQKNSSLFCNKIKFELYHKDTKHFENVYLRRATGMRAIEERHNGRKIRGTLWDL